MTEKEQIVAYIRMFEAATTLQMKAMYEDTKPEHVGNFRFKRDALREREATLRVLADEIEADSHKLVATQSIKCEEGGKDGSQ